MILLYGQLLLYCFLQFGFLVHVDHVLFDLYLEVENFGL